MARRAIAAVLLTLALTTQASCQLDIAWSRGSTHGLIVETNTLPPSFRVSVGIYKVPRKALYEVYRAWGIRSVQDTLWQFGRPPTLSYSGCRFGWCVTFSTSWLTNRIRSYIYDRTSDLRSALIDANARRNCLAITVFSNGNVSPNWTTKSTGCVQGALPTGRSTGAADAPPPDPEVPFEEWAPLTPEERARVEPDDLPFAGLAEPEIPTIDPIGQTTYLAEHSVPS